MWFGRVLEIKLKVTDIIPENTPGFGPTDLKVHCIGGLRGIRKGCIVEKQGPIVYRFLCTSPCPLLQVEPYMFENYLKNPLANNATFWTFTKCWGNAVLQPRYVYQTQEPGPMQNNLFPWFKSCFPWYDAEGGGRACALNTCNLCLQVPSLGAWPAFLTHTPTTTPTQGAHAVWAAATQQPTQ